MSTEEDLRKYDSILQQAGIVDPRILKIPSMNDIELVCAAGYAVSQALSGIVENDDKKSGIETTYFNLVSLELKGRMARLLSKREELPPAQGQLELIIA